MAVIPFRWPEQQQQEILIHQDDLLQGAGFSHTEIIDVQDPVSGRMVTNASAARYIYLEGVYYYFESEATYQQFMQQPADYVREVQ